MIEGYDPPKPNEHLLMKIAVVIGDALLTSAGESGGTQSWTAMPTCVSLESNVKYYPSL